MVPTTSSASNPVSSTTGTPSAPTSSRASLSCTRNSSCVSLRVPLYSAYSWCRNVLPGASIATTIALGFTVSSRVNSIDVKPNSAFVGLPSLVLR